MTQDQAKGLCNNYLEAGGGAGGAGKEVKYFPN